MGVKAEAGLPPRVTVRAPQPEDLAAMQDMCAELGLHTVCEEAHCPNRGECYAAKTATFIILGNVCTRACHYCAIKHGRPLPPNPAEPAGVARAIARLGLRYAVITSVTRDDLEDGGAGHFARTIAEIRRASPQTRIEVLVPDFRGDWAALAEVVAAHPDVIAHNIETVPRLYRSVRPGAEYARSLSLLATVRSLDPTVATKSGVMVGLGESDDELFAVMDDLVGAHCDILTVGQYMAPGAKYHPVERFVSRATFDEYRRQGLRRGFRYVASGPLVRSSYLAEAALLGT